VFDWLFEGRLTVYLALGAGAVLLVALWTRDRRRRWLIGVGVLAGLAGVYFLLDRLVETPTEQIRRKLDEMGAGVKARDAGAIFRHLSDGFRFRGMDKAAFRKWVEPMLEGGQVTEVRIWDVAIPEPPRGNGPVRVHFRAKPLGPMTSGVEQAIVHAEFVRDPDGQWRLKGFEISNPVVDTDKPWDIPGLPR
jgi:hypothetical protein